MTRSKKQQLHRKTIKITITRLECFCFFHSYVKQMTWRSAMLTARQRRHMPQDPVAWRALSLLYPDKGPPKLNLRLNLLINIALWHTHPDPPRHKSVLFLLAYAFTLASCSNGTVNALQVLTSDLWWAEKQFLILWQPILIYFVPYKTGKKLCMKALHTVWRRSANDSRCGAVMILTATDKKYLGHLIVIIVIVITADALFLPFDSTFSVTMFTWHCQFGRRMKNNGKYA